MRDDGRIILSLSPLLPTVCRRACVLPPARIEKGVLNRPLAWDLQIPRCLLREGREETRVHLPVPLILRVDLLLTVHLHAGFHRAQLLL